MKPFSGFPARARYTGIPALFFSALLPEIDDVAELKVTLHVFWLLAHRPGSDRSVTKDELLADRTLMAGFGRARPAPGAALQRGLEMAVARGTLLRTEATREGQSGPLYFVNSESGRQEAAEALRGSAAQPGAPPPEPASAEPQPGIYQLYEENIGLLSPMVTEKLKDIESQYPEEWIAEAIRLAVDARKASLRYIEGILKRWRDEGREHGEPGRHPEEDGYTGAWERYRARRGR